MLRIRKLNEDNEKTRLDIRVPRSLDGGVAVHDMHRRSGEVGARVGRQMWNLIVLSLTGRSEMLV